MSLYKDPAAPVEERVEDLLGQMTIEEKVGQIMQLDGRGDAPAKVREKHVGSLLHILNEHVSEAMDEAAKTRLGIPLLIGEDCIHGHSFYKGATIFPTQLGMASSWDVELMRDIARATAREVVHTGAQWTFSPVLCLTRDLRWGRVGETFGEDPYLIGEFAAAMIEGYQGKGLDDPDSILATAKHYAGYSETQGGRDASEADISRRKLRSYFLPPFKRAALAGCKGFMTGYQSMEGLPSTANHWLLTEVLRDEWGFDGVLVTDWDNVGRMVWEQKICANQAEAAARAVKAGNDLMMATDAFFEGCQEAIEQGLLTEEELDVPVRRVLRLKFRMGLFEDPRRPDRKKAKAIVGCEAHAELNLRIARESLVLLQNQDDFLPLDASKCHKITVLGANADDPLAQLGDWSLGTGQAGKELGTHPRECTTTVLDGIRMLAGDDCEVAYAAGCNVCEDDVSNIEEALTQTRGADAVVVVIGDHLPYIGEGKSTATLELPGSQRELLRSLAATGIPLVVVLINSKPMVLPKEAQEAAAIIEAFNPGMKGGQAIAEAIFGALNPSGKLTISIPRHVGQQPVFYSQVRGQHGNRYADLTQEPLFRFGHGLSYTSYAYEDLKLEKETIAEGEPVRLSVKVSNTGKRAGSEIVQAYVSDEVTSVTWVNHALKAFARVSLEPGESKQVELEIPFDALTLVDAEGREIVEPGIFEIQVGPSSDPARLLRAKVTYE